MIHSETTLSVLPCYRKKPPHRIITQEGYPYIILGVVVTLLMGFIGGLFSFLASLGLTLYVALFFRNPKREVPSGKNLIVAPADGKILEVEECMEDRYLQRKAKKISIFMSPFNCHINRSPIAAKVVDCFYQAGSFKAAFKPKAMETNEHHAVLMEDGAGKHWLVVQIAGFLARRIVSYVQGGETLSRGERFGLIQFGSRAELYCPLNVEITVSPGQKVYGGKTVLGRII